MRKGLVLFRLSALLVAGLMFVGCDTGFGRSGNADLSRLEIEGAALSPTFRADETEYSARVTIAVSEVTFNATTDDENATITINGSPLANDTDVDIDLGLGRNEVIIEVTAENESTKTYEIVITQVVSTSDDADISSLDVAFTRVSSEFSADSSAYDFDLSYWVNTVFVSFVRSTDVATVDLSTQSVTLSDNQVSEAISLEIGEDTTITLDVTSGSGDVEQSYSVELSRSERSDLSTTYFKASNTDASDLFGSAIAADGNTIVVGAYQEESTSQNDESNNLAEAGAGAVYVFDYSGTWAQTGYIKRDTSIKEGDEFGRSVAIEGDTLVVGAPGAESVHVYTRSSSGIWNHDQALVASDASVDQNYEFGFSVSLEGNYLIVGAPAKTTDQGAVYIFEWNGETWVADGDPRASDTGGRFGEVVQLNDVSSNPEFIVGAPQANTGQGEIFVYELDNSTWSQTANLDALENIGDGDNYGASVSILNDRIAVGAPGESSDGNGDGISPSSSSDDSNPDTGAVYLYKRNSQGQWDLLDQFIKAPNVGEGMKFGSSVVLSADMLAVGAPFEDSNATRLGGDDDDTSSPDSGAVYVYEYARETGVWTLGTYVKSPESFTLDHFGASLFFSGDNLVVGAQDEDSNSTGVESMIGSGASQAGAVYLYR